MPLSDPEKKLPLFGTRTWGQAASFSPDGRYVALESTESERSEIFVRPFPEGDQRVQVSTDGGWSPVWTNGGEILYVSGSAIVAAVDRDERRLPDRVEASGAVSDGWEYRVGSGFRRHPRREDAPHAAVARTRADLGDPQLAERHRPDQLRSAGDSGVTALAASCISNRRIRAARP